MSGQPAHWRSDPLLRVALNLDNDKRDRRAPADDPDRGAQYEAACLVWEQLTDEDIWGSAGRPPLPALPVRAEAS